MLSNYVNKSLSLQTNKPINTNTHTSLSFSKIENKNKQVYLFFDKLKRAYCNAMLVDPKEYETKTIATFFRTNNIKYPNMFEDSKDKFYIYNTDKKEIIVSNRFDQLNSSFNDDLINKTILECQFQREIQAFDDIFNKLCEEDKEKSKNNNSNEIFNSDEEVVNKKSSITITPRESSVKQALELRNKLINQYGNINKKEVRKEIEEVVNKKSSITISPRKEIDPSDINWYVDSVINHRKDPINNKKTQYLVKYIPDDYFEFNEEELTQWTNTSMLNCTDTVNDYRVSKNLRKIKSTNKRSYNGQINDITASEIDYDFVKNKYMTNQQHKMKRIKK
jgi:hypothetical protein